MAQPGQAGTPGPSPNNDISILTGTAHAPVIGHPAKSRSALDMNHWYRSQFLDSLSEEVRTVLERGLTPVSLPVGTILYEPGVRPRFVHFLTSGVASEVAEMGDGAGPEIMCMGTEGIVGATHLLGGGHILTRSCMTVPGNGLKIGITAFENLMRSTPALFHAVLRYVQYHIAVLSQLAGCNRCHNVEQRLARYLLMLQQRARVPQILLTQEFLAEMLGTQRTTITHIAGELQRARLIEYSRGKLRILNHDGLVAVSCECFAATNRQLTELHAPTMSMSA